MKPVCWLGWVFIGYTMVAPFSLDESLPIRKMRNNVFDGKLITTNTPTVRT